MNSLKELREWFLVDPENRWDAFKIADHYLTKYDEDPEMILLDSARAKTANGRVTIEERDELASKFWDDLLQRYTSGDVPEA